MAPLWDTICGMVAGSGLARDLRFQQYKKDFQRSAIIDEQRKSRHPPATGISIKRSANGGREFKFTFAQSSSDSSSSYEVVSHDDRSTSSSAYRSAATSSSSSPETSDGNADSPEQEPVYFTLPSYHQLGSTEIPPMLQWGPPPPKPPVVLDTQGNPSSRALDRFFAEPGERNIHEPDEELEELHDRSEMTGIGRFQHVATADLKWLKEKIDADFRGPGAFNFFGSRLLDVHEHPLVQQYNKRRDDAIMAGEPAPSPLSPSLATWAVKHRVQERFQSAPGIYVDDEGVEVHQGFSTSSSSAGTPHSRIFDTVETGRDLLQRGSKIRVVRDDSVSDNFDWNEWIDGSPDSEYTPFLFDPRDKRIALSGVNEVLATPHAVAFNTEQQARSDGAGIQEFLAHTLNQEQLSNAYQGHLSHAAATAATAAAAGGQCSRPKPKPKTKPVKTPNEPVKYKVRIVAPQDSETAIETDTDGEHDNEEKNKYKPRYDSGTQVDVSLKELGRSKDRTPPAKSILKRTRGDNASISTSNSPSLLSWTSSSLHRSPTVSSGLNHLPRIHGDLPYYGSTPKYALSGRRHKETMHDYHYRKQSI